MPENNLNTEVNEEKKQLTAEVAATAAETAADTAALPHDKTATDKRAAVKEAVFKYVAMALLIGSFIYFTVYGFLSNPFLESGTASEIGLKYPTAFKFWGFTTSLALTVNLIDGTGRSLPDDLRAYSFDQSAGNTNVCALGDGAVVRVVLCGGNNHSLGFSR